MNDNEQTLAKKAYIEYTKLQQLRKDTEELKYEASAVDLSVQRYNEILCISKDVLSQDTEISQSIDGLKPLEKLADTTGRYTPSKVREIIIDSGVLSAALESFIRWYLPVEKQKTIGFRSKESS